MTVVATGSSYDKSGFSVLRPDRAGIPGAGASHVLDPVEVLTDPSRCGERVVIVDDVGDHASLGVAQLLGEAGREVHIVTAGLFVGALAATTFEVPAVYYPMLVRAGVRFVPSTTVDAISEEGVSVRDIWTQERRSIAADTVVLNMLRKPADQLYFALRAAGVTVARIGDCVAPRYIDEAVYEGMELGLSIDAVLSGGELAAGTATHSLSG
jgi:hypothetical protein